MDRCDGVITITDFISHGVSGCKPDPARANRHMQPAKLASQLEKCTIIIYGRHGKVTLSTVKLRQMLGYWDANIHQFLTTLSSLLQSQDSQQGHRQTTSFIGISIEAGILLRPNKGTLS